MSIDELIHSTTSTLGSLTRTPAAVHRRRGRGWLVRRLLVTADVVGLSIAFAVVEAGFSGRHGAISTIGPGFEAAVFAATLPFWVVASQVYGLYDNDGERAHHSTVDEFAKVFHLVTVVCWGFFAFSWLTGLTDPSQKKLAAFWALAIVSMILARTGARTIARRFNAYVQNTVIVGAGNVGQLIGRKLFQHPEYGLKLLGFVDNEPREKRLDLRQLQLLGAPEDLASIVHERQIDRVIFAFSLDGHPEALESIRELRELNVQVDVVPRLYEALGEQVVFHSVEGLPLLGLPPVGLSRASLVIKRIIDLVGSAIGLLLVAPLIGLVALAIKLDSPGPVFFRQRRLGMHMREFTVLKFRTMRADADETVHRDYIGKLMSDAVAPESGGLYKLTRENEVTRVGRILRRTSLDELPQLVNVFRGEMSLVGPRPCIAYETEYFKPHHFERFRVPAGLTGLWQVTGRAHTTFADALQLDVAYARSWSLGLDLRLLARTPILMIRGHKGTE